VRSHNVVKEASRLVRDQLELMRALYEAKKTLDDGRSHLVCRCWSCRTQRTTTLDWVNALLRDDSRTGNPRYRSPLSRPT
jgi:hypothetical protein